MKERMVPELELAEAEVAVRAVIEEASKDPSRPMAVAVVDDRGDLVSFARISGASKLYEYMAIKKAYTAARFKLDTRKIWELIEARGYGCMVASFGTDMTIVPGGQVIVKPGDTIPPLDRESRTVYGGIGTSGRTPDEDEIIATIGLKALQNFLWPSK